MTTSLELTVIFVVSLNRRDTNLFQSNWYGRESMYIHNYTKVLNPRSTYNMHKHRSETSYRLLLILWRVYGILVGKNPGDLEKIYSSLLYIVH